MSGLGTGGAHPSCMTSSHVLLLGSLLLFAAPASAQVDELGAPVIAAPAYPAARSSSARSSSAREAERERRLAERRARRRRAVEDLLTLSPAELRAERAAAGEELVTPAAILGVGLAAVAGGLTAVFADMDCTSSSALIGLAPSCSNDPGVLIGGLLLAGAGAVTAIVSAIVLGVADHRRRRVDTAMELVQLALLPTPDGGRASVAVSF